MNDMTRIKLQTMVKGRDIIFEGGIHSMKKVVLVEILTAYDNDAEQFNVNNAFLPFGWWNNPYKNMKVGELKTMIRTTRNLKIKGIAGMKKVALVNTLIKHDANPDEFTLNGSTKGSPKVQSARVYHSLI